MSKLHSRYSSGLADDRNDNVRSRSSNAVHAPSTNMYRSQQPNFYIPPANNSRPQTSRIPATPTVKLAGGGDQMTEEEKIRYF